MKLHFRLLALPLLAGLVSTGPVLADGARDCFSEDNARRIDGCTVLIDTPGIGAAAKSLAHAMRALAHSLRGDYERAIPDYDAAIDLDPGSAIALNNRAWVLFKLARPQDGLSDVERSLALSPISPHAHDTRAHIMQSLGRASHALNDYERAMRYGGTRIVKLYQCGLQERGLYAGNIDGRLSHALRLALQACVGTTSCDPLPADEECRNLTS